MPASPSIEDLFSPNGAARSGSTKKSKALKGKITEIDLAQKERLTKEQAALLGLPYVSLLEVPITPESLSLIPKEVAEKTRTLAFQASAEEIRVGSVHPDDETKALIEKLHKENHKPVQMFLISEYSFTRAFQLYESLPTTREVLYGYRINEADIVKFEKEIGNFQELQARIGDVSTTDILTLMIGAALKAVASDIHVEAEEQDVKIRFRIDGLLQDAAKLPTSVWHQIISRLKLLAGVKINVEGKPQDGRITIYLGEEKIDIRASFLPTAYGESVVMRILRQKAIALEFEHLGVRDLALEKLRREIERPNGMIITTGPTGSGKTTTLYAILKRLNKADVKIITLEDPIEYQLEGINQSQIEQGRQYDFAKGLRSILRQDPDIVMVGEIRDLETAEIAIQAALTGHLVVSTLHTNSAAGAIPRFLSMGVKPFLLAPALNAIIGQRLVRRLCENCKLAIELPAAQLAEARRVLDAIPKASGMTPPADPLHFFGPGKGCDSCNHLGYKGRIGIYEIFTMNKKIEENILAATVSEYTIAALAAEDGMLTMAQDGLLKALDGLTSVEEVLSAAKVDAA